MKVLTTVTSLAIGLAMAGATIADDGFRLPGLDGFGIAPAPAQLIEDQPAAVERAKPLEKVLAAIDRRLPGRALNARLIDWQGRQAYAIRWIGDDGQVRDITADAVSGDILDER